MFSWAMAKGGKIRVHCGYARISAARQAHGCFPHPLVALGWAQPSPGLAAPGGLVDTSHGAGLKVGWMLAAAASLSPASSCWGPGARPDPAGLPGKAWAGQGLAGLAPPAARRELGPAYQGQKDSQNSLILTCVFPEACQLSTSLTRYQYSTLATD